MKTLKLKIATMIVVLFAAIGLYADCPAGSVLITETLTIGLCQYEVLFCVDCGYGPTPPTATIYQINELDPDCENDLMAQDVIDAAVAILFSRGNLYEACTEHDIVPCDSEDPNAWTTWEVRTPLCMEAEWFDYSMTGPQVTYTSCSGTSFCVETYHVCELQCPAGQQIVMVNTTLETGTQVCTSEAWDIWKPTEQDPGPTPCYIIHTDCNP